jgi:hypothetical protein
LIPVLKFAADRPYSDAEVAVRKMIEIAQKPRITLRQSAAGRLCGHPTEISRTVSRKPARAIFVERTDGRHLPAQDEPWLCLAALRQRAGADELVECQGHQTGAKQDKTCNGHSEKAF